MEGERMSRSSAESLIERVEDTLRAISIPGAGERVLVAVSGGPDSVCLLRVMLELGYVVEVAHYDHQTRAGESGKDAEFVRGMAGAVGCAFHLGTSNVADEARQNGRSFEEQARESRYGFFRRVASERALGILVTGHTADDQAETVLMRLIRGTSPHGLGGIPPSNEVDGLRIIRPLIRCRRREIMAFLVERNIEFRTDHTNTETAHVRNRVRHLLLPFIRDEFNPSVDDAVCRLAEAARCENDLLQKLADDAWEKCVLEFLKGAKVQFDRDGFRQLHAALQRRVMAMAAWRMDVEIPFDRIVEATEFLQFGETGSECDLGTGLRLRNGRDTAELDRLGARKNDAFARLTVPGETVAFGRMVRANLSECSVDTDWRAYCHEGRQVFDADLVGLDLILRHPRVGDRFWPLGLGGSKKLGDYFTDLGVPIWRRENALVIVAAGGIAWIVGGAMDGRFAVTAATRRVLEVTIEAAP